MDNSKSNKIKFSQTEGQNKLMDKISEYFEPLPPLMDNFDLPIDFTNLNLMDQFCGMHPIDNDRFPCYLKSKPEDFIVQEILEDGTIVPFNPSYFFRLPGHNGKSSILHGVMVKKNLESLSLIKFIEENIDINDFRMYHSGIKDKRAITSQRVAFTGINKKRLEHHLEKIQKKQPNVSFHSITYRDQKLKPSTHSGNFFTVVLKFSNTYNQPTNFNLEFIKNYFKQNIDRIPNYFGQQRFGNSSRNGHVVGWYLIKRLPEMAMKAYLGFPVVMESTKKMKEKCILLEKLNPPDTRIEGKEFDELEFEVGIAKHIVKYRDDPWKTLYLFPRTTIKVMIQSVASYVFNRYLQERMKIEKSLDKPIEGERVINNTVQAPVIGYKIGDQIDFDTTCGKIVSRIMTEIDINYRDFDLNNVHHLWYGFQGYWRDLKINIDELTVENHFDSKFPKLQKFLNVLLKRPKTSNSIEIRTKLDSGQYFTSLIRNLFYTVRE